MENKPTAIQKILAEFFKLLEPVIEINSANDVFDFLENIGISLPYVEEVFQELESVAGQMKGDRGLINQAVLIFDNISRCTTAKNESEILEIATSLIKDIGFFISDFTNFKDDVESLINTLSSLPDIEIDITTEEIQQIPENLFNYLFITYLQKYLASTYSILGLLGIIQKRESKPQYVIKWNNIPLVLTDPMELVEDVYSWGDPTNGFNSNVFLFWLNQLFSSFSITSNFYYQDSKKTENLTGIQEKNSELRLPLYFNGQWPNTYVESGLNISSISGPGGDLSKKGLAIMPYLVGMASITTDLSEYWKFVLNCSLDLEGGLGLILRPPHQLAVKTGLYNESSDDENSFRLDFKLTRTNPSEEKKYIYGSEGRTNISLKEFSLRGLYALNANDEEFGFEVELNELSICIKPGSDSDGFLQKILSGIDIQTVADLVIGISNKDGFYFRGGAGLELTIPIHKSLGPLKLNDLYLALKIENRKLPVIVAVSFGAELGPISASVEQMGVKFPLSFPENEDGNLGPINLGAVAFHPPKGAGLSISAGPVTGGGYVEFDNENKRYAGILELKFGEIGLIAIGLITTKMPDGSNDFSMLVVIGVTFDPPFTLPYNFSLAGVGGLLGIKRSMNVEFLRDGVKKGTLDSVLFPDNPVENAQKIISDLRNGFPATKNTYVVGPMAIIGWGVPQIISAEIGIFIQIPSPIIIAILGQITAIFPNADPDTETLVEIHLDVLGILNFEEEYVSIDASLYNSRILAFTLSGDMAFRLMWGKEPYFLMSLGGFNPHFKARPGTPALKRLTLALGSGNNPRIALMCYIAITSNSVQFGARLEVLAKKAGFKVYGFMYFDALFIFSPFSFIVEMGAGVEVLKGNNCLLTIYLQLTLSGPTPWNAKGVAKFKVLLFKIKVSFNVTWGKRQGVSLPAVNPWPALKEALENPANWSGKLPKKSENVFRLREFEDTETGIFIHPRGLLCISQKELPYNLKLSCMGNSPLTGDDFYSVTELHVGDQVFNDPAKNGHIYYEQDYFAMGNHIKMSDAKKISRPSFEKSDANIIFGNDDIVLGPTSEYELEYENIIIDEDKIAHKEPNSHKYSVKTIDKLIHNRTGINASYRKNRYAASYLESSVAMNDETFSVVDKNTMLPIDINSGNKFGSYSHAEMAMHDYMSENGIVDTELQILNEFELI